MKRCILLIFIICHGILQISAQNSVNASGGSVSVSSGFVSFSVGQPFFVSHITSGGSIIPGIQQVYEISTVGADLFPVVSLNVYPNPVIDYLILSLGVVYDMADYTAMLIDIKGNLLQNYRITESETRIQMSSLPAGNYFLRVEKDGRVLKTFKILKN